MRFAGFAKSPQIGALWHFWTLTNQYSHVSSVDVIPEKVEKLNNKISPIQDDYIEKYCYIAAA